MTPKSREEEMAAVIYGAFVRDDGQPKPAWIDGGNSRKQGEARRYARALIAAGYGKDAGGWRSMESAPKNRKPVLLKLHDDLEARFDPEKKRGEAWSLDMWQGRQFVGSHPGVAKDGFDIGWNFAAPVGQGGFPDHWFEGWLPLPGSPPAPSRSYAEGLEDAAKIADQAAAQCWSDGGNYDQQSWRKGMCEHAGHKLTEAAAAIRKEKWRALAAKGE